MMEALLPQETKSTEREEIKSVKTVNVNRLGVEL